MTKTSLTAISPKTLPEDTHSCWSCGSMRAAHFCASCGKVQPPVPVDYFTFFGLPPKLDLNVAALEKEFYELSRKLHPDLNARDRKSTRLNSSHIPLSRMPSSA